MGRPTPTSTSTALPAAQVLVPAHNRLGEGTLWCDNDQALWWTDIDSAQISRWLAADGEVQHWSVPEPVGSFALCQQPGLLLLGLASGVALFDTTTQRLGPITPVPTLDGQLRLNDGRCDPQGRFIVGQFNQRGPQALGHFWRVDHHLQVQRLPLPPCAVANALSFSPDGAWLYCTDSPTRTLLRVPYGPGDGLGRPEVLARLAPDDGEPDGATVDAAGRLWVALWGAACVVCFSPDGQELQRLPVPALHPTCPVFGGPARDRLFVSSARKALDQAGLARWPAAGDLFVAEGLGPGRPEHRFATRLRP